MEKKSVSSHLEEFRSRIIVVTVFLVAIFFLGFFLSDFVLDKIRADFISVGSGIELIVITPFEFIYTKIQVGLFVSLILTLPVIIYQGVRFVKPGLKRGEKGLLLTILPASVLLFALGLAFGYFLFLKVGIWFLAKLAVGAGVSNLWSLSQFVSFVFVTSTLLGLVFQLPLVMILLVKLGILSRGDLVRNRAYVVLGAFVMAAIISPPDVVTMFLLALPLWVLYEVSVALIKVFCKEK